MQYKWKDIVKINGKIYSEEHEVSGVKDSFDDKYAFDTDDFFNYLQEKYGVDYDDIETYMFDDIDFDPKKVLFDIAECGVYARENENSEWVLLYEGDEI